MYVFKSRFGNMTSRGFKKLGFIAVLIKGRENYLKMHREHIVDQNSMGLFHFFGKNRVCFIAHDLASLSSSAPIRLRSLILTAPKLVISSIFIWV